MTMCVCGVWPPDVVVCRSVLQPPKCTRSKAAKVLSSMFMTWWWLPVAPIRLARCVTVSVSPTWHGLGGGEVSFTRDSWLLCAVVHFRKRRRRECMAA